MEKECVVKRTSLHFTSLQQALVTLCEFVLYLVGEGVQGARSAGHQPSLSQLCPIRAGSAASVRGVFDLMMPAEVKAALEGFLHLELILPGCFGIPVLR